MSYIYLLSLYEMIEQRLDTAAQKLDGSENDSEKNEFIKGQIHALSEFKEFLTENLNSKLPKRIRKQLEK